MQFEKDGSGNITAANLSHRDLWGAAVDQLLAQENVSSLASPGDTLWALTDNLNSVRDLVRCDTSGETPATTLATHRVYDAYGNKTSETNAAVDCVFGYTGKLFDSATGLQNNLNRWYDASTGKWISQDPIGYDAGDVNLYRYCANTPVDAVDVTGLEETKPHSDKNDSDDTTMDIPLDFSDAALRNLLLELKKLAKGGDFKPPIARVHLHVDKSVCPYGVTATVGKSKGVGEE